MTDCTVLCMKWGTLYSADYVNVLHSACRRASRRDFRFVCLTDDAAGLAPGIEALPIPEIGLEPRHWKSGGWPKIGLFQPGLGGFTGRAVFVDLDMVVLDGLDDFFDHPAPFVTTDMGPNWRPGGAVGQHVGGQRGGRPEPGTCLFAFTFGEQDDLFDRFTRDIPRWTRDYRHEQAVIGFLAGSMDYWPAGWVISFKRWLRQPVGLDLIRPPRDPAGLCKVLAFHGEPRPIDLIRKPLWGEAPHLGRGPVDWMRRYWVENGGPL